MRSMLWLKEIVESTETLVGRAFDLVIQSLIVASLASFAAGTNPDLSSGTRSFL